MRLLFFIAFITAMAPAMIWAQNQSPIEVTADQELEWNRGEKIFVARGNAKIIQGADSITASKIIAHYDQASESDSMQIQKIIASPDAVLVQPGQRLTAEFVTGNFKDGVLSTIIAKNNVVLKTDEETLSGDRAVYDSIARVITVTGNVKIQQDQNILTGSKAEFDLNTNISRMTAGAKSGGRVKAIFYGGKAE